MSSRYASDWILHHSVEILGYHQDSRHVKILFVLLAENKRQAGPNELRLLHRGKTTARLECPWPLPLHPDESAQNGADAPVHGLLAELYGQAFTVRGTRVMRRQTLDCCDAWKSLPMDAEVAVTVGTPQDKRDVRLLHEPSATGGVACPPFSTWTLGPFSDLGVFLIAFTLEFRGATYKKLVDAQRYFTVDGPVRLISRIKYDDILELSPTDQEAWRNQLEPFERPGEALQSRFYDIVILDQPFADAVRVRPELCSNGIYSAPRQPKSIVGAQRFVTADPFFTLPLSFANVAVVG